MPIEFACPHCQRPYKVADTNAGKRFACKQCGNPVQIPGAPAPQAAPVAPRPVAAQRPAAPVASAPRQAGMPASPYGGQPGDGPKSRAPNYVFLGGAAAMTIGFFMPWISIEPLFNFGGYELPGKFMDFVRLVEKFVEPGTAEYEEIQDIKTRGSFLYSMYLIPMLCLGAGIEELIAFKKGRNFWWLRALAAASPVIAFITVMIAFSWLADTGSAQPSKTAPSGGPSIFDILGFGVWICFIGFLAATAGIFTSPKPKSKGPAQAYRPRPPAPPRAPGGVAGGPRPVAGNRPPVPRPKAPGGPRLPGPKLPRPRQ